MSYVFKIARSDKEFSEIHKLNYKIFVEEIPQHDRNEAQYLIDPFHEENTYLVCYKNQHLIGMIAVRDQRPFSLDRKLGNIEEHLPIKIENPCEIRLLAVEKEHRNGRIFLGLAQTLARYCLKKGYDGTVISGTTRQLKLYEQMGFRSFAYLVGKEDAYFQPMYLTRETFEASIAGRILPKPVSFLPGPVKINEEVAKALQAPPISHRSEIFKRKMEKVKESLQSITKSKYVEILFGSGTLANDAIAWQLKNIQGNGLILVNGEFGERLEDHAIRAGLQFDVLKKDWGTQILKTEITETIQRGEYKWLWAVHCETSTGMLNNLKVLKEVCETHQLHLCMDCISSVGVIPLDLNGVYLASGVSGKGFSSYVGLSFVFHHHQISISNSIPRYLDLGYYQQAGSIPFSHGSILLETLLVALSSYQTTEKFARVHTQYKMIRTEIEKMGLQILTPRELSTPAIMTICFPKEISAKNIGEDLEFQGYQLHYENSYLLKRNWLQIACMGVYSDKEINSMLKAFKQLMK